MSSGCALQKTYHITMCIMQLRPCSPFPFLPLSAPLVLALARDATNLRLASGLHNEVKGYVEAGTDQFYPLLHLQVYHAQLSYSVVSTMEPAMENLQALPREKLRQELLR